MNSQASVTDQLAQLRSAAVRAKLTYAVDWLDGKSGKSVPADNRLARFMQITRLHPLAVNLGLNDADDFIQVKFRSEFI